ncbi:MAG: flavodoxin domain-containing protein [Solirubrobacteraceae bacterium]
MADESTSARVLVAYGSKFGATAEIAESIGRVLTAAGLTVDVQPAGDVGSLTPYRAVVVGSAVYSGRWRRDAAGLLRRWRKELAEREVWVFSSGPVGEIKPGALEGDDRWIKPKAAQQLAKEIGAHEHVAFGGRVSDDAGGLMRKRMAKGIPPELRDRRDWAAIEAWAAKIAAALSPTTAPAPH